MPTEWQVVVGQQESEAMRQVVADTLAVLVPGVRFIEQPDDVSWTFSSLHYITPVHVPPLFKPSLALSSLRARFSRDVGQPRTPRRIYVARDTTRKRAVLNEHELIKICQERDFNVVFPERSSIVEQARLFQNTDLVVGIKGASLTNALFSSNISGMIVPSPGTFTAPFFWDLVGSKPHGLHGNVR